jgi:hypothetical protein
VYPLGVEESIKEISDFGLQIADFRRLFVGKAQMADEGFGKSPRVFGRLWSAQPGIDDLPHRLDQDRQPGLNLGRKVQAIIDNGKRPIPYSLFQLHDKMDYLKKDSRREKWLG